MHDALAGTIRRQNISGSNDESVAVFATRKSGIRFLMENNAWGFVYIGDKPDHVAMYVSRDVREVRYFATVKEVVPVNEAELAAPPESYVDRAKIDEGKKVLFFEPDSLYELEDPILYASQYPQSLRYTTLEKLRTAKSTDDLF